MGSVAQRVVSVAVHYRLSNLLVLLLGELISSKALELHDGDSAEVASIGEVSHVRVIRVIVDEVGWVYVLLADSVVRVVGALGNSDAAGNKVLNTTAIDAVVEVVPRKGHLGCQLRSNLGISFDVGVQEDFRLLWSIGKRRWVYFDAKA